MPKPKHLYREIFKKAFIITWKNRFLWLFGLFITFLGVGSAYEMIFKNATQQMSALNKLGVEVGTFSVYGILIGNNIKNITLSNIALFTGTIILSMIIIALALWASVTSLGGIIDASAKIDKRKKTGFKKSFRVGMENFWKLLAVNLSGKILIMLFLLLTGGLLSVFLTKVTVWTSLLYLLLFLIFVTISLSISFLMIYASSFIILKKNGIIESVHNAWRLFLENWVVTIESSVILFLLSLIIKFILIVSAVFIAVPFMLLLLLAFAINATFIPPVLIVLWSLSAIMLMVAIGSFFSAYQIVAWILLFDKISKGGLISKLHRIFRK